ncbi:MAG TPA: Lin1244/Lin1753 domain-containing protein [Clostridiaceae bacterium]
MARPKKQTIEYFPHSVNHGKTIFVLESKYSNDGYAFWFKLLELLGNTSGMVYECRNIANWEFLLAKTRVNDETANNILNTLSDLDAIDKTLWTQDGVIWVQNLIDNVRDAFKRRVDEMPQKPLLHAETPLNEGLCMQKPQDTEVSVNKNGESKVKESKLKESKVKYMSLKDIDELIEYVKITSEQYQGLIGKFGEVLVKKNIVALDNYIANGKGRSYKDHYRALNTWCLKDNVKKGETEAQGTGQYNANTLKAMELYEKYKHEEENS